MCGIVAVFGSESPNLRKLVWESSKKQRHRGPDWSGIWVHRKNAIAHERLAIVGDTVLGDQPIVSENKQMILGVNGEIYNYKQLERNFSQMCKSSDCEVLLYLYESIGPDFLRKVPVHGMYAFVLRDEATNTFIVARDPVGIIPLYMGLGKHGGMWFASEIKALVDVCVTYQEFPPGHIYDSRTSDLRSFYTHKYSQKNNNALLLKRVLHDSVQRHLMTDAPFGVLLSGGLDSSIIAYLASMMHKDLHTFSIGLPESPDTTNALAVSGAIGSTHHAYEFTVQQGLTALSDVIYHIETYDVTTIRASVPMYLLARRIRSGGFKMVLSGEGADEIFGGYLYFHKAPSPEEFQRECMDKLKSLHHYDCLRANKSMMAWGVETRVPFLDLDVLDYVMNLDSGLKMCRDSSGTSRIEKWILRDAFRNSVLPENVLWRQKEQFSDGVGYSWIDGLKAEAEKVSDAKMQSAHVRFPHNTPKTKEAYWYRELFVDHFGYGCAGQLVPGGPSVACSTSSAMKWDDSFVNDPSGRCVDVHDKFKKS